MKPWQKCRFFSYCNDFNFIACNKHAMLLPSSTFI